MMNLSSTLTNEERKLFEEVVNHRKKRQVLSEMELSPHLQRCFVNQDMSYVLHFKQVDPQLQLDVVKQRPDYGLKFSNPCEEALVEAVKRLPNLLSQIKKEYRSERVCRQAFLSTQTLPLTRKNSSGAKLASVPKPLRTDEMIELSLRANGVNIKSVKNPSVEWSRLAVEMNPYAIEFVDATLFSEDELFDLLKVEPYLLKHLSKEQQTPSLVLRLLALNGLVLSALKRVPTEEEMEVAFQQNPEASRYFVNPSLGLAFRTIKSYGQALMSLKEYQTPYWCEVAFKSILEDSRTPWLIHSTATLSHHTEFMDFLLVMNGFVQRTTDNPEFDFIYLQNLSRSDAMEERVSNTKISLPHFLQSTAENLIQERQYMVDFRIKQATKRLLKQSLKTDGCQLKHIPGFDQTEELGVLAMEQTPEAIKYLAPHLKSYRLCRYVASRQPDLKLYSPYHLSELFPQLFQS